MSNLVDKMRDALQSKASAPSKPQHAWNEKVVPGEYPRHIILPDGSSETVYGKIAIRSNGQVVPLRGHSAAQIDKILGEEGVVYLDNNMTMPGPVPTGDETIHATAVVRLAIVPVAWDRWDEKTGEREGGIVNMEEYITVPVGKARESVAPELPSTATPETQVVTIPGPLPPPTSPHLIPTTPVPPHFIPVTTAPAPIVPGTPDDGMGGKK